jgi:transglutaminase-like putative cysteine protease
LSDNAGDLWYYGAGVPNYTVISAARRPTEDALRNAYGENVRGEDYYLQLPPLTDRVLTLADSLVRNRPTRYDSVMAVQTWLRTEFSYTLDLPATPREATLDHFLFVRRKGHCEYFSTALAILLRTVGIPARNVNGFMGGSWNEFGGFLTVTQNEAHSWVEVWFPRYGWVTFDATPAATVDVAQALGTGQRGRFLTFFDGIEHRWNKWILEYNLEAQVSLFQRVATPFARRNPSQPDAQRGWLRWLKPVLYVVVIALALRMVLAARRSLAPVRPEARGYLKLRRGYEKAGFTVRAHDAPLAFLARLQRAHAPGLEHAQSVVAAYLRARFSTTELTSVEQHELAQNTRAALRALRKWRGDPSKPAAAA